MAQNIDSEKAAVRYGKIAFASFGVGLLTPMAPLWVPVPDLPIPTILGDVLLFGLWILIPILSASMALRHSRLFFERTQRRIEVRGFHARPIVALILACYAWVSLASSFFGLVFTGMGGSRGFSSEALGIWFNANAFVFPILFGVLAGFLGILEMRRGEAHAQVLAQLAIFIGIIPICISALSILSAVSSS